MSEQNFFQKIFANKTGAVVDGKVSSSNGDSVKAKSDSEAALVQRDVAIGDEAENDGSMAALLDIPVLGRRTVVGHQRLLAALLALALIVLAIVTFYALTQADKVTQQLNATGQALMQSQRLAKSASQAIVGTPQAFPDVKESWESLSKNMQALEKGDDVLRIDAEVTR